MSAPGREVGVRVVIDAWCGPRDARAQIASGAGGRFALAGAKCERRLPARYGPAPEVHDDGDRRGADRRSRARPAPACVYAETETADTVSGAPEDRTWWDGPVTVTAAGTTARPSAVTAQERHMSCTNGTSPPVAAIFRRSSRS
ncbi:hypothetical protein GCM10010398_07830 [Streptomyces fimbriatus]